MKNMRRMAIPGLVLAGALMLAGCGDKDEPAMSPAPSESGMMEDDAMMTPSPSPTDGMMDEDDKMDDEDSMMDDSMSPSP